MFFEIYLNLKKQILVFRMRLLNRILSAIFFISFLAMILFNLSISEFNEYYLFQKILFVFIFVLSFIGTFYMDELKFNKGNSTIQIKKGFVFLYKKFEYSFDDLDGIIIKKYLRRPNPLALSFSEKYLYNFGFKIKNKYIMLENRLDESKYKEFLDIFKSFYPKNVEIINI